MILTIGGGALATIGAIITIASVNNGFNVFSQIQQHSSSDEFATGLVVGGAASMLLSIPLFIKVRNIRNAARAILFPGNGR